MQLPVKEEIRAAALRILLESCPAEKSRATRQLYESWQKGGADILTASHFAEPPGHIPGRPQRPLLLPPKEVMQRSMRTVEGRAALIHALAHIEFNAINLALDAIWRFADLPLEYYSDWLKVAAEEAYHFSLLNQHLATLGYAYGDFAAHNSLWEMARRTSDDVLARTALVPRTLEARGLDATPAVRAKLAQAGDQAAAEILDIILHDEIGHVGIGNHWFAWLCSQRGVEPESTYTELVAQFRAPVPRPPINRGARLEAGFSETELAAMGAE